MDSLVVPLLVVLVVLLVVLLARSGRSGGGASPVVADPRGLEAAVQLAVTAANERAAADRDAAVRLAVQQLQALNAQQQAGDQQLIEARLTQVREGVVQQVQHLSSLVQQLGESTAQKFGDVDRALQVQAEAANSLQSTTASLSDALAHPNARGQWGERMADDVLRLAGLLPNVNYRKRTAVEGEGRVIPDFTFFMPDDHVLFMDVKFPIDA